MAHAPCRRRELAQGDGGADREREARELGARDHRDPGGGEEPHGRAKTLAQVSDLQRWLGTDEVVEDVCDLIEDLRTPLYEALEDLRSQLAA